MSVLVDTGILYAHHDQDARRHDRAVEVMNDLLSGAFGRPYVSDYVYDEAVTLARRRTHSFESARMLSDRILGEGSFPEVFEMLHVNRDTFRAAIETWIRYDDQGLSFTDATLITLCEQRGIDGVLTFDSDFDGLITRYDPLDYA